MYVLIVYDVAVERVAKAHKCLKRFLHWRQNSVFEGELTEAQIETVKSDLQKIIDEKTDSVWIYIARNSKWLKRESLGQEKNTTGNLL